MKQQVIVIHGGTTFDTYEQYFSYLKTKEIDPERLRQQKSWKNSLPETLGENYDCLFPQMPNGTNAKYKEWKLWFERLIPYFDDDLILIGHSLGGIFLAKYLSENKFPKKIKATILISPPFDDANGGETLSDFKLSDDLSRFSENSPLIYLVQSKDDPTVPFEQHEKYVKALPTAKEMVFEDRQHFNTETFPEITQLIKSL